MLSIKNRWPALPDGRHEVVLHAPEHCSSFPDLGQERSARVIELWSARTAELGSRDDVAYVFVFENRGRKIGSTIEHPHSQIMAFATIPPWTMPCSIFFRSSVAPSSLTSSPFSRMPGTSVR